MIDIKKVKANGISFNPNYPDIQQYRAIIQTAISVFRLRHTTEEIWDMIVSTGDNDDYYFGSRFNDDERVASRAISAVCSAAFNGLEHTAEKPTEEQIETAKNDIIEFFEKIDGKTMDYLIVDAMRDCASADHWYKYEKQWD